MPTFGNIMQGRGGRTDAGFHSPSYGGMSRGMSRAPRGLSGPRGAKRKTDLGYGAGQSADSKKIDGNTWTSPPIAQQPLGQMSVAVDGYGDGSEWYQDSYGQQNW